MASNSLGDMFRSAASLMGSIVSAVANCEPEKYSDAVVAWFFYIVLTFDVKGVYSGRPRPHLGRALPAGEPRPLAVVLGMLDDFSYPTPSFDTYPCPHHQHCNI